jgi:hypothetical protein
MENVIFVYDRGVMGATNQLLAICGSTSKAETFISQHLVNLFPMPEGLNMWEQEEIDNKRLDYKRMNIDCIPMSVDSIDL